MDVTSPRSYSPLLTLLQTCESCISIESSGIPPYISNPDVEHHNSYATFMIDGEPVDCYTAYITTKSYAEAGSGFMSNDATALVPVDGTDVYYTREQASNFDEIFQNHQLNFLQMF